MLLFLTLFATISIASFCTDPLSTNPVPFDPYSPNSKREAQYDAPYGPSPITIDLPPEFLPPPWSPFSNLDSPYPNSGVSPWDDSGRSQMVDNEPPAWRTCPLKHLDCRICPRDYRCRRPQIPEWDDGNNEPGAIIPTSQFSGTDIAPEDDGQSKCLLTKCDNSAITKCGTNARCTRGFCVCDLGMKGSWRHGEGFRGTEGLGEVTVYVWPDVDCDTKCDGLSCKEVEQLEVGSCWRSGNEGGREEGKGEDSLEPDAVRSGSVNLPSAGEILGLAGDFVAGVADMRAFGEAN